MNTEFLAEVPAIALEGIAHRRADGSQALYACTLREGRPRLDGIKSRRLWNISSLAFGGPDLRTAYLGCLLGDSIATFRSPFDGAPPVHCNY